MNTIKKSLVLLSVLLICLSACKNRPDAPAGQLAGSVEFIDTDMGSGELGGTVTVERSADESMITHYVLYWGSGINTKLAEAEKIGEVAVLESTITYEIPQNTAIPAGATHILAFVKSGDTESVEGVGAEIVDLGSTVTVTISHSLSNVESFNLSVSGDDMTPAADSGDASTTQFVVEVKDGTDRTFEVSANIDTASAGAALGYSGTTVADLTAGEPANVNVTVDRLSETKIVIPDPEYNNLRLVQIDDMSGIGWTELQGTDLGWGSDFYFQPYDVDFDNQGRIYVANNYASTGFGRVVRFNDITGAGLKEYSDVGSGVKCLAVDRNNNVLYYADYDTLWKCTLDDTSNMVITLTEITTISGLAVDDSGNLYIAGDGSSGDVIFRYNTATASIDKSYGSGDGNIGEAWDVIVKNDSVFIANYLGTSGYLIMEFDKDLNFIQGYGDQADDPLDPAKDEFNGPHRFVAILNRKITVTDEIDDMNIADAELLISFDDMDGNGWEAFNPTDSGKSAFHFLAYY